MKWATCWKCFRRDEAKSLWTAAASVARRRFGLVWREQMREGIAAARKREVALRLPPQSTSPSSGHPCDFVYSVGGFWFYDTRNGPRRASALDLGQVSN